MFGPSVIQRSKKGTSSPRRLGIEKLLDKKLANPLKIICIFLSVKVELVDL
ncbi:MAG: hypothetical protein QW225_11555 [Candidatus Jordarchaeales archaeon]